MRGVSRSAGSHKVPGVLGCLRSSGSVMPPSDGCPLTYISLALIQHPLQGWEF